MKFEVGVSMYRNYLDWCRTRCLYVKSDSDLKLKLETCAFTKQRREERGNKSIMETIFKADRDMVLHCSNDCCAPARANFNDDRANACTVSPAVQSVRYVASATDEEGNDVHFLYRTRRHGIRSNHIVLHVITRRVYKRGKLVRESELRCSELPNAMEQFTCMKCCPLGRFCAISYLWRRTPDDDTTEAPLLFQELAVWDSAQTAKLDVRRIRLNLELKYGIEVCRPSFFQDFWWATDDATGIDHFLVAWNVTLDVQHSANHSLNGFAIVDHTQYQRLVLDVQASSLLNSHFCGWYGVLFRQYSDGKKSAVAYEFKNGPDQINVSSISAANGPKSPVGTAHHEFFINPISACITSDGQRVAILAQTTMHLFSQPPSTQVPYVSHCILALFTKSRQSNYYYRERGGRDETYLPFPTQQNIHDGWSLSMSPCNSLISVVYTLNLRLSTPQDRTPYPSAFFVQINPSGIACTNPILNAKLRLLTWTPNCVLLVLRYGAVILRPRVRVSTSNSRFRALIPA